MRRATIIISAELRQSHFLGSVRCMSGISQAGPVWNSRFGTRLHRRPLLVLGDDKAVSFAFLKCLRRVEPAECASALKNENDVSRQNIYRISFTDVSLIIIRM